MKTQTNWPKDPDAVLDYSEDWTAWLAGDTITALDVEADDDLTIEATEFTGAVTTAWISGGEEGNTSRVRFRITTEDGRIDDRSIFLEIQHR